MVMNRKGIQKIGNHPKEHPGYTPDSTTTSKLGTTAFSVPKYLL